MNQEDFRRLVSSGGGGGGGEGAGGRSYGGKRQLTDADLAEIKKLSKRPKKKSKKPASKGDAGDGDDGGGASKDAHARYRDRAAERRKGAKSGDMIDADEFAHLDAEQSKFLGGDMEHTHLVKGLDFALLAQLKREKEKLQKVTADAKREQQATAPEPSHTSGGKPPGKLTFTSRMGRLVYFHACHSNASATFGGGSKKAIIKSELFLPGRMDYTFNLSEFEVESIPVSVQRSKEDCPEPDEVANGIVDEELISRIGDLLRRAVPGKKMRKKKRDHERHGRAGASGHGNDEAADGSAADEGRPEVEDDHDSKPKVDGDDDDDENIFSDVDDYVPVDQRDDGRSEPSAAKKAAIKSKGYFSNLSASISATEAAARKKEQEEEDAWKATFKKAVKAQAKKEQEEAHRAKAEKLAAMTSEYDEYYDEYQAAGTYDDSDDEKDASGEGKKRRKAAAGGDGEIDDAERSRRKQQKHSNKLQNDLEKINQIMEKKRDGGK